jgi:hypothetical protein
MNLWKVSAEGCQRRGEILQHHPDSSDQGNPAFADQSALPYQLERRLQSRQDRAERIIQPRSKLGCHNTSPRLPKQHDVISGLERADLFPDRRHREADLTCCSGVTGLLEDDGKRFQLLDVQVRDIGRFAVHRRYPFAWPSPKQGGFSECANVLEGLRPGLASHGTNGTAGLNRRSGRTQQADVTETVSLKPPGTNLPEKLMIFSQFGIASSHDGLPQSARCHERPAGMRSLPSRGDAPISERIPRWHWDRGGSCLVKFATRTRIGGLR